MADLIANLQAAAGAGGGNAWDLDFWTYSDQGAPNLTYAYLSSFVSISAQQGVPSGVFFKPDGTKMYVIGSTGDDIDEYDLSTAWDITTRTYVRTSATLTQETGPSGLFFSSDGTRLYTVGSDADNVNQYSLSTAWDVSTISFVQSFSVSTQDTLPTDLFFKPDGTKMYVSGDAGNDINEYSLSTAWDISTASYVQNFSVLTQDSAPLGLSFTDDGLNMFVVGNATDKIYRYTLSSAWDISTASISDNVGTSDIAPNGIFITGDGKKLFEIGGSSDEVDRFAFGKFYLGNEETGPAGVFFKTDGTKMYIVGFSGDDVNEYDLSTAWDITTASYVQNFSLSAKDAEPRAIFFKSDGSVFWFLGGGASDSVHEYSMSSSWNVSTASFVRSFSVSSQEATPTGLFFKPDGTKMYVSGAGADAVNEYSLSTPWDISTASFTTSKSVGIAEVRGVFFRDDGTNMYVLDDSNDSLYVYTLSTEWDISSATLLNTLALTRANKFPAITGPQSIFFKPEGDLFYIVDNGVDTIYSFAIQGA
jgi:DNA-binding beta-propeller fold protein YncE